MSDFIETDCFAVTKDETDDILTLELDVLTAYSTPESLDVDMEDIWTNQCIVKDTITQALTGLNHDTKIYFDNATEVTWATLDPTNNEVTITNVPNDFTGEEITLFSRSYVNANDTHYADISLTLTDRPPTLNSSDVPSDIDDYAGIINTTIDISSLFIDPEGLNLTYELEMSNGKSTQLIIYVTV